MLSAGINFETVFSVSGRPGSGFIVDKNCFHIVFPVATLIKKEYFSFLQFSF